MPDRTPQPERYVDASVVAAHLSLKRQLVVRLARKGMLPSYPIDYQAGRKMYRFRLSEVDHFMQKNGQIQLGARPATRDNSVVLGKPS